MRKLGLCYAFCLLLAIPSYGQKNKQSKELFNGKNLKGWYKYVKDRGRDIDPLGVFSVRDGAIRISGEEYGAITTNDSYDNYRLVVEFKWGQETYSPRENNARDSGLLLHAIGEDGVFSGSWMHSLECQMIEGGTGDFIVVGDGSENYAMTVNVEPEKVAGAYVYNKEGKGQDVKVISGRINWYGRDPEWKDVLNFRGKNDLENAVGEWNKLECLAEGDTITVFLNGVQVNQAFHVKPTRGKIQIQSEGAELFIRKVTMTKL